MKYLLDADTLIDYILDRGNARPRITIMIDQGDEVAVCAITVAEVYSGLSDKRRDIWESWIMALSYWHIGFDVAAQAGTSGRRLLKQDARYRQLTRCLQR